MTSVALACMADVGEIARIAREQIEDGLPWSWTPRRVAASIRRPDALVVVARAGVDVAGFGVMRYADQEAHLDLLAVERAYRGRGLGRRLVEWLEKPALVAGITDVFLEARESRHGARAFYARLGYHELGRLAGYYCGIESAIRMGRDLALAAPPRMSVQPDRTIARDRDKHTP